MGWVKVCVYSFVITKFLSQNFFFFFFFFCQTCCFWGSAYRSTTTKQVPQYCSIWTAKTVSRSECRLWCCRVEREIKRGRDRIVIKVTVFPCDASFKRKLYLVNSPWNSVPPCKDFPSQPNPNMGTSNLGVCKPWSSNNRIL